MKGEIRLGLAFGQESLQAGKERIIFFMLESMAIGEGAGEVVGTLFLCLPRGRRV